jgi:phospholipid transport system substrate-binding protein
MMRALRMALLPLLMLAGLPALAGLEPAANLPAPHQVVYDATGQVLDRIVRERPRFEKEPDFLYVIIEENLVPYVDFERIARRVMAKYYMRASDAQRAAFTVEFKRSLIRAYGAALGKYDKQRFVILPAGKGDVLPATARVNMEMTMSDGVVYPMSYSMFTDEAGRWKLENLVLNGINLGLTYRNNFADLAEQYGGDIDKVIANWNARVEKTRASEG